MSSMPFQICFAGMICGFPCFFSAIGQAKTAAEIIFNKTCINSSFMKKPFLFLSSYQSHLSNEEYK